MATCRCGSELSRDGFCMACGHVQRMCVCIPADDGNAADNVVAITAATGKSRRAPKAPFVTDGRPEIDAGIGDLADASSKAQHALSAANKPARYFSHGGELVRIEIDDEGRPFTRPLGVHHLMHHLARAAHYFKVLHPLDLLDPGAAREDARPPLDVVHDLLASPDRMWPTLRRIVSVPVFAEDGSVCQTPGYNPAAKAWFHPGNLGNLGNVPQRPSDLELAQSVDLVTQMLTDFPFVEEADRAHALAMMLQPFARDLITGPTPLYLIEKPEPGTGATLLSTAALWPALGRAPKAFTEATNEEEWRKRITSALRESPDVILVENLHGKLSTASLAAVLTMEEWGDRLLGVSEMTRLPVRCAWVATANNPRLSTEMIRRSVRIRMDSGIEQPWLRQPDDFHIPDLKGWVTENRPELVRSCLTIVRAWIVAGRPSGSAVLGMFESWARTMSGILDVAGVPGFLKNQADFYSSMAEDDQDFGAFVLAWYARYAGEEVGAAELWPTAQEILDLGKGSDRSQQTLLGQLLRDNVDRRFGDLFVRRVLVRRHGARWRVESR